MAGEEPEVGDQGTCLFYTIAFSIFFGSIIFTSLWTSGALECPFSFSLFIHCTRGNARAPSIFRPLFSHRISRLTFVAFILLTVSWHYGTANPSGTLVEKNEEGEVAVTSKRGNVITRKAKPDDPAVHVAHSGNDVVKNLSELEVEEKGAVETETNAADDQETIAANGDADENMTDDPLPAGSSSADAATGEKRAADEDKAEEEPSKKAKVGRGRPKKVTAAPPAIKKAPTPKAKATEKKTDTAAVKKAEAEAAKKADADAKKVEKAEKAAEKKAEAEAKKGEKAEADAAKKAEAKAEAESKKAEANASEPAKKAEAPEHAATKDDEPAPTTTATKKGRGRPKKDEKLSAESAAGPTPSSTTTTKEAATPKAKGASKKKERPVPNGTGVGSRTRSSKKWETERNHQQVPLAPPPDLETGGVIFFLIQNHQKVSRTLGFVASASPLFIWTSGPLSRSPFLPFFFFAPPLSLRQSAPFGGGGGAQVLFVGQSGGKGKMEKVALGNGRRWLVQWLAGWVIMGGKGEVGNGDTWFLVVTTFSRPSPSAYLNKFFFVHSFNESPYLFLMWAVWFRCAGGLHNKGRSCVWFCNWVPNADRRSFFVLLRITTTMGHRQMG